MTYHNAAAIVADTATAVVERAPLTRAFEIVTAAVDKRTSLPILDNARMQGDGSALFVTATNLDIELTVAIPAAADSRFAVTIPAAKMRDLLKKATASCFVAFTMPEKDKGAATADFERVKYRLATLPVADFPNLDGPTPLARDGSTDSTYRSFTMTGAAFWAALDSTMSAISTEATRYYLNGIYMHVAHDGALRFVATDGHRLYRQDMAAPDGSAEMPGVIIPLKTVAILHKLLKGKACPDSVGIELTATKLRVTWGDADLHVTRHSKFIDGTYPDYERVIPPSPKYSARFEPEAALEAIRAVALIGGGKARAVKLTMKPGRIALGATSENDSASADIEADSTCPDGFETGYNSGYITDAIATASPDGAAITWRGSGKGDPTIFTGSREGWMAVLMPMRV